MNPLIEERQKKGLTRKDFARRFGLSYDLLYKVEGGYWPKLPRVLVQAMAARGYSEEELADLQQRYRIWRASDLGATSGATA